MAIRRIFEDSVVIRINPSQNFCTIQYMILDALGKYTKSAYQYNFPCAIWLPNTMDPHLFKLLVSGQSGWTG